MKNVKSCRATAEFAAGYRLSLHPNINSLLDVLHNIPGRLVPVFELMEMNMYEAVKSKMFPLPENRINYMIYQVLKAIDHMHRNGIKLKNTLIGEIRGQYGLQSDSHRQNQEMDDGVDLLLHGLADVEIFHGCRLGSQRLPLDVPLENATFDQECR